MLLACGTKLATVDVLIAMTIGATIQSIQAMKEVTASLVGADAGSEMGVYFDYICAGLA